MSPSDRQVKVLASVTEGSDISENWHPILSVIRENASSWDRSRVTQQLKVCGFIWLNISSAVLPFSYSILSRPGRLLCCHQSR